MEESPAEAPVETPPASTGEMPVAEMPVAETPAPEPAKRGRGRPPGAKNKPKIVVKPVEVPAEETVPAKITPTLAASSAEVPAAPAPKKARTVRVEEPKETIDPDVLHRYVMQYAFAHANRQAAEARNQKANRYDALVARMVR